MSARPRILATPSTTAQDGEPVEPRAHREHRDYLFPICDLTAVTRKKSFHKY
jgi:hypothetical protein